MKVDSYKKNGRGILLMVISSFFVCFGQYFWKVSVHNNFLLLIGFCLYGIGAMCMLIGYRYGSLSVLQPVLSINYVFSLQIGYFLLYEQISLMKIIGVVIVIVGVLFIAGGD